MLTIDIDDEKKLREFYDRRMAQEVEADDEATLFDADFALMTMELARFIPALLEAFGGENESSWGVVNDDQAA